MNISNPFLIQIKILFGVLSTFPVIKLEVLALKQLRTSKEMTYGAQGCLFCLERVEFL